MKDNSGNNQSFQQMFILLCGATFFAFLLFGYSNYQKLRNIERENHKDASQYKLSWITLLMYNIIGYSFEFYINSQQFMVDYLATQAIREGYAKGPTFPFMTEFLVFGKRELVRLGGSYGEEPDALYPRSRYFLGLFSKINGVPDDVPSLANMVGQEAQDERKRLKKDLIVGMETYANVIKSIERLMGIGIFAHNPMGGWHHSYSVTDNFRVCLLNLIAENVFGIPACLKIEDTAIFDEIEKALINHYPENGAAYQDVRSRISNLNDVKMELLFKRIITSGKYVGNLVDKNLPEQAQLQQLKNFKAIGALFAGSNLIALISIALERIYHCPEVLEKLRMSLNDIDFERLPTSEEECKASLLKLAKVRYLQAVYDEALRYGASATFGARLTENKKTHFEFEYAGKQHQVSLNPNSVIFFANRMLAHSQRHWDRPDLFRPDRFLEEGRNNISRTEYKVPFNAGPRRCPASDTFVPNVFKLIIGYCAKHLELTFSSEAKPNPPNAIQVGLDENVVLLRTAYRPGNGFCAKNSLC
ncbi:MAG: hypothetical protein A3E85_03225 [Gammaproteobacteria bacterium RIFCSPHIGHO2_12_FULL_45_12]|nr:MAG: hypothetical protein A3E85_03225 [Gammaproteobacteria bacterium RIFCSPHIGHO2_12_FULL_45_12]